MCFSRHSGTSLRTITLWNSGPLVIHLTPLPHQIWTGSNNALEKAAIVVSQYYWRKSKQKIVHVGPFPISTFLKISLLSSTWDFECSNPRLLSSLHVQASFIVICLFSFFFFLIFNTNTILKGILINFFNCHQTKWDRLQVIPQIYVQNKYFTRKIYQTGIRKPYSDCYCFQSTSLIPVKIVW